MYVYVCTHILNLHSMRPELLKALFFKSSFDMPLQAIRRRPPLRHFTRQTAQPPQVDPYDDDSFDSFTSTHGDAQVVRWPKLTFWQASHVQLSRRILNKLAVFPARSQSAVATMSGFPLASGPLSLVLSSSRSLLGLFTTPSRTDFQKQLTHTASPRVV